ncbi:MAG: DUF1559 domain-containing protein [Pirellulaceae bacterium]|nr:DUF1559 domain-containing protein [Pirellulaceae bacterium]
MPISFSCPHCGHATQVADHFAGQTGPCASCGNQVSIPLAAGKPIVGLPRKSSSANSGGAIIAIVIVAVLGIMVVCGGIMAALLLPAVQAAREAARRMECQNHMKQIGLAMHNYHDTYKTFPPAYIADEDGEPMRSWRASILPFVEQTPLYDRYDFHVRWNAPENQFAVNTTIPTYTCPSDPAFAEAPTDTNYVLITGTGTIFEVGKKPTFRYITDGTSNTIMAVEMRGSGINWSEPRDLDIEAFVAMFGPSGSGNRSSPHPGGLNVLMADGSVRFLSFTISQQDARAMATSAGGERVRAF